MLDRYGLNQAEATNYEHLLVGMRNEAFSRGKPVEVHRLAENHQVSMPISKQIYGLVQLGWDAEECLRRLMSREQKAETS